MRLQYAKKQHRLVIVSFASNRPLPLFPDTSRFGSIVLQCLFEPRMAKGFDGGDALVWVVHEDFLQEIGELFVERGVLIDGLLRQLLALRIQRGVVVVDLRRASSSP